MTDDSSNDHLVDPDPSCPQHELHTLQPSGYLAWHQWAARMNWTHSQRRCPGCNLYNIWVPRKVARTVGEADAEIAGEQR